MKSYIYLLAGFIVLSGTVYAQKGSKVEKEEIRVEVESEDPGGTYHVKIISENEHGEKIYEKTYGSLEDWQKDTTLFKQGAGGQQDTYHIQIDNLPGDFEWTSVSDSLGKKVNRTAGVNFVFVHTPENEPGLHFTSDSDSLADQQSYEIRIKKKLDSTRDDKEISKEIWVLKDQGGHITIRPDEENENIIRIERSHDTLDETSEFPSEVKEVHLQDVSLEDEDFSNFNIDRMPVLVLKTLHYYPNPNAGQFTLTFSGPKKPVIIRILDEQGNLMYEENLKNFSGNYNRVMNIKEFNEGKYLLQIHQRGKVLNKKLMVE